MASPVHLLSRLAGSALKALVHRVPRRSRHSPPPVGPTRTSKGPGITYAPAPGGTADPGEIVWTWVPYEDDPSQGKDRPVLIIGHEGNILLALMLTSRDRNNKASRDPRYVDIGSGAWDRKGRPSEVYLKRIIRVEQHSVRRIGTVLERRLFDRVISGLESQTGA